MPGLLYADEFGLCGESEEDLRIMVLHFVEVCSSSLKVNAGKNKVLMLGKRGGIGVRFARTGCDWSISEFKYLGMCWNNQVHMRESLIIR